MPHMSNIGSNRPSFGDGESFRPSASTPDRRRFLRTGLLAAGTVAAGGLLTACGSSANAVQGRTGSGKTIGVSLNGVNGYTTYLMEGVLKELDGTGYKFVGVQNNFDSSTELGNIQNLLSQGIAGLVVLPTDASTIARAAKVAAAQGVAVSNALWSGKSNADRYFAGVADLDSVEGGRMIGRWLLANVEPGKVIVVQGIVGQGFSERIDKGLDQALAGSGFEIVLRQQGYFDRNTATKIVESGLQAHPDVKAVVSYAASMGDGIAAYLKSAGITDVKHVTSDCDDEMLTWLGTPYLSAARYYSAAQTGQIAVRAVRAKLEGRTPGFLGKVDQTIMTKANMAAVLAAKPYRYKKFASKARI
ncbi:sugar ABC transporter substrate-binding protein [Streptomyces sp. NPDC096057]|uniref:sugar ABC transporter substrate-binding protein n=1 Tax=Streptomyces sp. NPDC096057 TaxID=3155543 RepID=UPI003317939A